MKKVDLSQYQNSWYDPGAGVIKRTLWLFVNAVFFRSYLLPCSGAKRSLLRLFGATIGSNVVIKPHVNIKYPWYLSVGDNSWIGEDVWIDNLTNVKIGSNCCLSQGAYILTGNHDYSKATFDLSVKPVSLEEGVWIGAFGIVCPGVICLSHSVLTVRSVATKALDAYTIYCGNPAIALKKRNIS